MIFISLVKNLLSGHSSGFCVIILCVSVRLYRCENDSRINCLLKRVLLTIRREYGPFIDLNKLVYVYEVI